jgi:predicted nucleotidyltransferase
VDQLSQTLSAQGAPASHLRRIAELQSFAKEEPAIRAIALVGSYAKGLGDRVSDLDLVAFVDPGTADRVLSLARPLLQTDDVLHQFTGRNGSTGAFCKLVYLDFSTVEFHVAEPGALRLRRPYLAVWDPHDSLSSLVIDGEPIRHEDFAAYQYGDDGLLWELVDCVKWLSRGQSALAKRHIQKIASEMAARGADPGRESH